MELDLGQPVNKGLINKLDLAKILAKAGYASQALELVKDIQTKEVSQLLDISEVYFEVGNHEQAAKILHEASERAGVGNFDVALVQAKFGYCEDAIKNVPDSSFLHLSNILHLSKICAKTKGTEWVKKILNDEVSRLLSLEKTDEIQCNSTRTVERGLGGYHGLGGYVGLASSENIRRCDHGVRKREYAKELCRIAEIQANLGYIQEAKASLNHAYMIVGGISISDFAELVSSSGYVESYVSTWGNPGETADSVKQDALKAAQKASARVNLIERLSDMFPDHGGDVVLSFVMSCIKTGKIEKAIRILEEPGKENTLEIISESIDEILDNVSKKNALRHLVLYALSKPNEDNLRLAFVSTSKIIDRQKVLENEFLFPFMWKLKTQKKLMEVSEKEITDALKWVSAEGEPSQKIIQLIKVMIEHGKLEEWEKVKEIVKVGKITVVPFIDDLKDRNSGVRRKAAEALDKLCWELTDDIVEPLIQALKDEDKKVRRYAARALGDIGDAMAIEPLIQALKDEDKKVRKYAARAIEKIEDARAVEQLIETLKDDNNNVRKKVVEALEKIGGERAIEPIIQASKDKDGEVRKAAEEALERIQKKKKLQ